MFRLLCLLMGYGLGCIQTAYIVGRVVAKIDVREHGSGNAGTSNVIRVVGRSAGLLVFACDVLKAIAAYIICQLLFDGGGTFLRFQTASVLPGLYGGLGVVLGHNFPFFLKFKGGKGIASTMGILLALDWRLALIIYLAGIGIIWVTRYISLGSLVMTLLIPILLACFGYGLAIVLISFCLTAMAYYLHRSNIKRLLNGTERKLSLKNKKTPLK